MIVNFFGVGQIWWPLRNRSRDDDDDDDDDAGARRIESFARIYRHGKKPEWNAEGGKKKEKRQT